MKNIKLTIAYDGTNYSGWQRQNNARTVQEEIEKALYKILKKSITIHGSGRTDAGVHALGQVASFTDDFDLPVNKIPFVINNVLPKDIVIKTAEKMDMDFHARYCAKGKKYIYKIFNDSIRNPIYRNHTCYINGDINIKKLTQASKYFIGEHDFRTFMASGSNIKNTVRTIYNINIYKKDKFIILEYDGNGFLYKMVRIITATLLDINFNRISPKDIESIIKSKDRSKAKHTAPAQGLYLDEVYY